MEQNFPRARKEKIKHLFAVLADEHREKHAQAMFAQRRDKLGGSHMKTEDAQESPAAQAQTEPELLARPANNNDLPSIMDATEKLNYYDQLFDVVAEAKNWPLLFSTHHERLNWHEMRAAMANGLLRKISEYIRECRNELRKLNVADTSDDANGVMIRAELAAEKRGQKIAAGYMDALRAEIAALGEKLATADEARKQAETKARSAVARSAAAKRASKRAANAAPKRKPARKKR